jgi:hypothetical protein
MQLAAIFILFADMFQTKKYDYLDYVVKELKHTKAASRTNVATWGL